MPGTAASLGVNPHVPYQNIQGTVRYLKLMLDRFRHLDHRNQMKLALASYNAGYGAVTRYGGVPPYAETQNYVQIVMAEWYKLSGER
jgi:soluble lytic murein transglycosylase-like protein